MKTLLTAHDISKMYKKVEEENKDLIKRKELKYRKYVTK
tara:strand:+ start:835 stop:951 length:117 start_codon:yes stop_codon:yes gene_type:complete